ncbi:hypothetical protein GSI_05062 [Ganoderma sinense ZZ0214-1]|uniref:Uncharacterized protein n=1 Tax=Ganoderma sinense ZZ0214-1 TaxID=1077348 RepID=A0A2G8SGP3_9APHY|nr:hypothetical protein GSI_05062 [Ganoderma sinense ZZ0214-1]
MLMSVSKDIAGSHLQGLNLLAVPHVPDGAPHVKRARTNGQISPNEDLAMREAVHGDAGYTTSKSKTRRGRKKSRRASELIVAPAWTDISSATIASVLPFSGSSVSEHPFRTFYYSPFAKVSAVWASALREASPVQQGPNAALYFYPPPFLIDTIPSATAVCRFPEHARVDDKVPRYLLNLARIREFCRARIFDRTLDRRPLTIGEWRVALWGDYHPKIHSPKGPDSSEVRREKRRQDERNVISLLFHQVAHLGSYSPQLTVSLVDATVDATTVMSNPDIRATLLWEAHELNFRADVMALDHLLVDTSDWLERSKWEREMMISAYDRPAVQKELERPRKDAPVKKAANMLTLLFRAEITGPGPAETQDNFKLRVGRARKGDRDALARKEETMEEFTKRMEQLPDKVYTWVSNWRGSQARKSTSTAWNGPVIPAISLPRQPQSRSGLDMFQLSQEAPQVPVVEVNGRTRADVAQWRRLSKVAWDKLTPEKQEFYTHVAQARNEGEEDNGEEPEDNGKEDNGEPEAAEGSDEDAREEKLVTAPYVVVYSPVVYAYHDTRRAEDVAHWIDILMEALYKQAGWAGFVCVAGPDHKGELHTYGYSVFMSFH